MGQSDRPGMTLGRKVAYAIAVVVVLLLAAYLFGVILLGNEPPIRVKNGSIKCCLPYQADTWKYNDDNYSWSPSIGSHDESFQVKVAGKKDLWSGECTQVQDAEGNQIDVSYSGGGGVSFTTNKKNFWSSRHTAVHPLGALDAKDNYLTYGSDVAGGYISRIVVMSGAKRWTCTFAQQDGTLAIDIGTVSQDCAVQE